MVTRDLSAPIFRHVGHYLNMGTFESMGEFPASTLSGARGTRPSECPHILVHRALLSIGAFGPWATLAWGAGWWPVIRVPPHSSNARRF